MKYFEYTSTCQSKNNLRLTGLVSLSYNFVQVIVFRVASSESDIAIMYLIFVIRCFVISPLNVTGKNGQTDSGREPTGGQASCLFQREEIATGARTTGANIAGQLYSVEETP